MIEGALAVGSYLNHNNYRIERVLGQGGYGITYLALDMNIRKLVAIKEFFPKNFCNRADDTSNMFITTRSNIEIVEKLKAKFIKEAQRIARLDHPNIVRIVTAFEENNTAYYVMDYIEGESLYDIVRRFGRVSEPIAIDFINKIGNALSYLHSRRINHLDVKPANIMIRRTDNASFLIDFGISKQYDQEGNQTSTTPVGVSHGYAPMEQYRPGGVAEFTPQTDVYSLAATLYYILSGTVPPNAHDLYQEDLTFPSVISSRFHKPISRAMDPRILRRYPSVDLFLADIHATSAATEPPHDGESTVITSETTVPVAPPRQTASHPQPSSPPPPVEPPVAGSTVITPEYVDSDTDEYDDAEITHKATRSKKLCTWLLLLLFGSTVAALALLIVKNVTDDSGLKSGSITTINVLGTAIKMVYVRGGEFQMGNSSASDNLSHPVALDSYWISQKEITQGEWKAVMGFRGFTPADDGLPAGNLSWNDCQNFIDRLNEMTDYRYQFSLPTEAEWEYAARGGELSQFYPYSGSADIDRVAWYGAGLHNGEPHYGANKDPNELNIFDMTGNMWEWCSDWYSPTAYENSTYTNPSGPGSGKEKVIRGGGYIDTPEHSTVYYRAKHRPDDHHRGYGFRIVAHSMPDLKHLQFHTSTPPNN